VIISEIEKVIADIKKVNGPGKIPRDSLANELRLWRTPRDALGQLRSLGHVAARYLEIEFETKFPDIPTGSASPE
jgi:hypothetical protein